LNSLADVAVELNPANASATAWDGFGALIRVWLNRIAPSTVLEIGGGRAPLLKPEELESLGIRRYIINDVSAAELARVPAPYETECFDIQVGPDPSSRSVGACDLVFSMMVMEHIADPRAAWSSMHRLLRPGGTALAFMPVLFSPPFLINRLIPEMVSQQILRAFFPRRHHDDMPKFPAYYRWCRASTEYMRKKLEPIGYSNVTVIPFYGHAYFVRVPVIRQIDHALSEGARRSNLTLLASYAYVMAVK
jgi:SAM-dependent methyltransferase